MDRTLKRAKRPSKRRNHRNAGAWRRFSPDGTACRFCEHDGSAHLCASGQPVKGGEIMYHLGGRALRCGV